MNGPTALDEVLRARGLRATPQRRLVLDALVDLGHATPEQVLDRVQRDTPTLNLSTVYRTLELLEELGLVTHTHLGHGAPAYHPAAHADHIHLVCRRCGTVSEADIGLARALAAAVDRDTGFDTDVAHLSLHGVCAACTRAGPDDPHDAGGRDAGGREASGPSGR